MIQIKCSKKSKLIRAYKLCLQKGVKSYENILRKTLVAWCTLNMKGTLILYLKQKYFQRKIAKNTIL